jgi:hypothetical protein
MWPYIEYCCKRVGSAISTSQHVILYGSHFYWIASGVAPGRQRTKTIATLGAILWRLTTTTTIDLRELDDGLNRACVDVDALLLFVCLFVCLFVWFGSCGRGTSEALYIDGLGGVDG